MPNLGRETAGAIADSAELMCLGHPVTMPATGAFSSVTAYMAEGTSANEHVTCAAIYNATTGALLGQSATRQDISLTPDWVSFTFSPAVNVTSGTDLVLAVASGSGSGLLNVYRETGASGDGRHVTAAAFPTLPDPVTFTNNDGQFSIYGTYTAGGGDGPLIPGRRVYVMP